MIKRKLPPQNILSNEDIESIHKTTMDILSNTGIEILHEEALKIFKDNGARVEGKKVYLSRKEVEEAVKKAPALFTLHARNPDNSVIIGGNNSVLSPGFGAPYVVDSDNTRRRSTLKDYINFTKLGAEDEFIDTLGGVLVELNDVPEDKRHAKMIYVSGKYSDKTLMGSALGKKKALDCFKMISMLFGEDRIIDDRTVSISIISTTSPLKYDTRMLGSLMEHARYNQAVIIASLLMGGLTGPMTIAGNLVIQNAEVLTGIVLTQMINPGAPVVYGSASTLADLKTANLTVGTSEYVKFVGATAQLARYYNLPSRAGGVLTDSLIVDTQAGYDSMMTFLSSINYGINFFLHTGGLLDNYMSMSYEKFVIDQEIMALVADIQSGIEVNRETLAGDLISEVGPGGNYLEKEHTFRHMKDMRQSEISERSGRTGEEKGSLINTFDRANERWQSMISDYETPYLDPVIERKLMEFIKSL
ncbi:MAG: trimethylamine methyltransferase family protein [bacterium]